MVEGRPTVVSLLCLPFLLFGACSSRSANQELLVTLKADGQERAVLLSAPVSVDTFLHDAGIEPGALDRFEPPTGTMLRDGMRVTLVRVREFEECEHQEIPYQVRSSAEDGRKPATSIKVQNGIPGEEERCYLVLTEDGVRRSSVELGRVLIREPVDELWQDARAAVQQPLVFDGTLVWISEGDAWIAHGDSSRLQQVTHSGDLDGKVLSLSATGEGLLYTRYSGPGFQARQRNQLWLAPDVVNSPEALRLLPEEVSTASWLPGSTEEFGFTTQAARHTIARMRINPASGEALHFQELVAPATNLADGLPETTFAWSPDGQSLAWAQADAVGLLDPASGSHRILLNAPADKVTDLNCVQPALSWSPDSRQLLSVLPTASSGQSAVVVTDVTASYDVTLFHDAGPCAAPVYAPVLTAEGIAFLKARNRSRPDSRAGHDLMLADRDGSNPRLLYPVEGQPGLDYRQLVWSPGGHQLAFIYQGRLWLLTIASGEAHQFSFAGKASALDWAG